MPVSKELINIIGQRETVELLKITTPHERDSILSLTSHTPAILNVINLDKYLDYPKTIPIVYRVDGKITGLIVGIPIENYSDDDTFPDPDMNKRNTVYTVIFQYNNSKIANSLEKEYLHYLTRHNIKHEARHIRIDRVRGSGFKKLKIFNEWKIDSIKVCYCKRMIDNV